MNNKEENLRDLLRIFYSESEAAEVEDDILRGERILAENAAPQPEAAAVSNIKLRVSSELAARQRHSVGVYVGAGLTAAAAVLVAVGLFLIQNEHPLQPVGGQVASEAVWEVEDFSTDDAEMAILAADIEAVEDEILALQLGENGSECTNVD